ncbi:Endochitinase 1 [Aphanomyces cochlioides]|nr:Endochitinase 1 [Aphanomyces cochlioides]
MRMARAVAAASLAQFILADGYRNVVYFPEWSVETNFTLESLDWSVISHINYAYAVPQADGSLHFEDETAAFKTSYDGVDGDLRGSFGLANKLKRQHRHVKVGISIGSSNVFSEIAASSDARDAFVKNAVALMLDLGLDFVDIDWQFPATPDEIDNYIQLLNDLRAKLNELAFKAELTIASVGYHDDSWAAKLELICSAVDAVNVMAYDYAGAWSAVSGFQSNLYSDERSTSSVADIVQFYLDNNCPSKKLVVGIPVYSRKFQDTDGLYKPFDKESTERDGFSPYKDLPIGLEQFDATTKSASSYDAGSKTLQTHNLAGTMFWHAQQDAQADDRSLIHSAFQAMGKAIDSSLNNVNYPTSMYDNVRQGSYGDAYGCRDYTVVKGDDVNKIVQAQCYQRGGYCHPDGFPVVVSNVSGDKCPYWIESTKLFKSVVRRRRRPSLRCPAALL